MKDLSRRDIIKLSAAGVAGVFLFPQLAFADESKEMSKYKEVMNNVNVEYGVDFHFLTPQDCVDFGVSLIGVELPPISIFESTIRSDAERVYLIQEENLLERESVESEFAAECCSIENGGLKHVRDETGRIIATVPVAEYGIEQSNNGSRATKGVTVSKGFYGGTGKCTGTISDSSGYWFWLSAGDPSWVTASFKPHAYLNYSLRTLIDGQRTLSATWNCRVYENIALNPWYYYNINYYGDFFAKSYA